MPYLPKEDNQPITFIDQWLDDHPASEDEKLFFQSTGFSRKIASASVDYAGEFRRIMGEDMPKDLKNKPLDQFTDEDFFRCGANLNFPVEHRPTSKVASVPQEGKLIIRTEFDVGNSNEPGKFGPKQEKIDFLDG